MKIKRRSAGALQLLYYDAQRNKAKLVPRQIENDNGYMTMLPLRLWFTGQTSMLFVWGGAAYC